MRLEEIRRKNSVSEIFEYIIENSCSVSNTNKNLEIRDWNTNFDYECFLINEVVNKTKVDSSLDILIVSNTRNFKNIYMNDLDLEDVISRSRCSIFFLFCDYFQGKYDNEIEREFGFEINGDIEQFKKLFTKENVDIFVSHLLVKSSQIERKGLSNRVTESVKLDGKWRSVSRYLSISEVSWEQSVEDEQKKDVESYLYKINQLNNEEHTITNYKADNIYSFINANKQEILTDKQLIFLDYYLNSNETTAFEEIFKCDDDFMSKQLKVSYRKNIRTRVERELLSKDDKHIKQGNGYYTLIKTDNERFIKKLLSQKDNRSKFELIAKEMKKSTQTAKDILEVALDTNTLSYFNDYLKGSEKIDTYRFLSNTAKFNDFIEKLINRLDSDYYERAN